MNFVRKMIFSKCEFCVKWDSENANFVKKWDFEMWIFGLQCAEKLTHPKNCQNAGFTTRTIAHNDQMIPFNVTHDFFRTQIIHLGKCKLIEHFLFQLKSLSLCARLCRRRRPCALSSNIWGEKLAKRFIGPAGSPKW